MKVIDFLERPLFSAMTAASAIAYQTFGLVPRRQRHYFEMALAVPEIIAGSVFGLYSVAEGGILFAVVGLFVVVDALHSVTDGLKALRVLPRDYDAEGYKAAVAEAKAARTGVSILPRLFGLLMVIFLFVDIVFLRSIPDPWRWFEFSAMVFLALFTGKFYLRACDPPQPLPSPAR